MVLCALACSDVYACGVKNYGYLKTPRAGPRAVVCEAMVSLVSANAFNELLNVLNSAVFFTYTASRLGCADYRAHPDRIASALPRTRM